MAASDDGAPDADALAVARTLPKTELHLHLDGSLDWRFCEETAARRGVELPCAASDLPRFARNRERSSMQKSLSIFDVFLQLLQTGDELRTSAQLLSDRLAADGVTAAEVRFCPALHTREGLSPARAVQAVAEGLRAGALGERSGVIVTALRSLPPSHSLDMAHLARDEPSVLAFDVAGDEQRFPLPLHAEALEFCRVAGVPLVPHCGEWFGTLDNVRAALDAGAVRLGHGIQLGAAGPEAAALRERAAAAGVTVECCLSANVGGRKAPSYAEHPIRTLFDSGVRVALSSDNLTVSGSLATGPSFSSGEVARLHADVGFSWEEVDEVLRMGREALLLPPLSLSLSR